MGQSAFFSVGSASVHTQETTQQKPIPKTYQDYLTVRQSLAWHAAMRLYLSLSPGVSEDEQAEKGPYPANNAELLNRCRTRAWFCRSKSTGIVRVIGNACRLRWCPLCAAAKRRSITHQVVEWLKTQKKPKFLTLTLKHADSPLPDQIAHLYKSFTAIRRRQAFKRKIKGGIWFFQLKKSDTDGKWHPHLHCLIVGSYIEQRVVAKLWHSVTKSSIIVDIRAVRDAAKAAEYVARYAASPAALTELTIDEQQQVYFALHGRRLCGSWGRAKSVEMSHPKLTNRDDWQRIGSWRYVIELIHDDITACAIFEAWRNQSFLPSGITLMPLQAEIDGETVYHAPEPPPQQLRLF